MIVAFDIETIPDLESGRALYDLDGIGPEETAKAMLAIRRQKVPDAVMLPLHMHRVVAVSVAVFGGRRGFEAKSIGEIDFSEERLVSSFFQGIAGQMPTLVSWNGNGFDLPVLQYRALIHGIQCKQYWDTGQFDNQMKWNNYHSRYQGRHVDVMDVLARYQMRGAASLDDMARMIGLPGKIGIGGASVFQSYIDGKLSEIRDYCEIDALNTFLVYLRLEYIRGRHTRHEYDQILEQVRSWLKQSDKAHFQEFEREWIPRDSK